MQNPIFQFPLSSEDCEFLVALESAHTLSGMASLLKKDLSVVSRRLQRIAAVAPVLEKDRGRWALTEVGRSFTRWARDAHSSQRQLLRQVIPLRICATREFGARFLSPNLGNIFSDSQYSLSVLTSEEGVEHTLLSGDADVGFDCGRPRDPLVAFRRVVKENFTLVASRLFIEKHQVTRANLLSLPHLQYKRSITPRLLKLSYDLPRVFAGFNDIASIREACCAGIGWAVLPGYAVRRELDQGLLREIPGWPIEPENFGVWWIRGRRWLDPIAKECIRWLKTQDLS